MKGLRVIPCGPTIPSLRLKGGEEPLCGETRVLRTWRLLKGKMCTEGDGYDKSSGLQSSQQEDCHWHKQQMVYSYKLRIHSNDFIRHRVSKAANNVIFMIDTCTFISWEVRRLGDTVKK